MVRAFFTVEGLQQGMSYLRLHTFDVDEAFENPKAILAEILTVLGESMSFNGGGVYYAEKVDPKPADDNFEEVK